MNYPEASRHFAKIADSLPESQKGEQRHRDAIEAYRIGRTLADAVVAMLEGVPEYQGGPQRHKSCSAALIKGLTDELDSRGYKASLL